MRNFIFGFLLGSLLTTTLGLAATFYDSKGHPNAPSGSVQQFDYFRQRQQFIDIGHLRDQADKSKPCAR